MFIKYLILGSTPKTEKFAQYCVDNDISFLIVDPYFTQTFPKNTRHLSWVKFFDLANYSDIIYDSVINFRDNKKWMELENNLSKTKIDKLTLDFLTKKSIQNKICLACSIPTIPNKSEKIIVKTDAGQSGGDGFFITNRTDYKKSTNEFIQDYQELNKTLNYHYYVDGSGTWHLLNTHVVVYKNNCPTTTETTVDLPDISHYVKSIKKYVRLKNRIVFWQFVENTAGDIFNMDFNCRPAGGFDMGSYDTDTSDIDFCDILHTNNVPETINYHSKVLCTYKEHQQFGYADVNRKTEKCDISHKVVVI